MKRVAAFCLVSVFVFFSVCLSVSAFTLDKASPSTLDKTSPFYQKFVDYFVDLVSEGDDIRSMIESGEFDSDYFDLWYGLCKENAYDIYDDSRTCGFSTPKSVDMIDSSGTFSDDYLMQYKWEYDYQTYMQSHHIDWDEFCTYAKARYLYEAAGGSDFEYDIKNPNTVDPVTVPSEVFKDVITSDTTRTPKNTRNIMSWRNDPRYSEKGDSLTCPRLTWYSLSQGGFVPLGGGDEIYMIPYYTDGDHMYFGTFQFHAVFSISDFVPGGGGDSNLFLEWLAFEPSLEDFNGSKDICTDSYYSYFDFSLSDSSAKGRFYVEQYLSLQDFSNRTRKSGVYFTIPSDVFCSLVCADDLGLTLDMSTVGGSHFGKSVAAHDESCDIGSGEDMGYFCSSTPIELDYHIDTQRIPDNYYITVEGDTVYDYTITNPDTGQSSTVNEYITNNYTYVTNEGGSSSGGTVGGNVTVGGQIDVSGSVDVGVDVNVSVPDININVNGGAGGTGALPDVDVNTDPLDEYLNSALEESSGIRHFFAAFFDFCPPEIFTLLCIGLTFVVLGRILGR